MAFRPFWKERVERVLASDDPELDFGKLKSANADLMIPLEELAAILRDGVKKCAEARSELQLIDTDLKKKLLELQR